MNRPRHDDDHFVPKNIQSLPRDLSGRAIPFFARWVDDVPDLDFVDARKLNHCVVCRLCWICGLTIPKSQQVGFTLTIGNVFRRSSTTPPQHVACAKYAARVWPMTLERISPLVDASVPILKVVLIPKLVCVWITRRWGARELADGLYEFDLGTPSRMIWYAHGRELDHDEIQPTLDRQIADARQAPEFRNESAIRKLFIVKHMIISHPDSDHEAWDILLTSNSITYGVECKGMRWLYERHH